MMKAHFVCTGNTYRSRLAEAYFNSLSIPGWTATSSGIGAQNNLSGNISSYAERILKERGILEYTAPNWQQTTPELLNGSERVIFMKQEHFEFCRDNLGFAGKNYLVWDVDDVTSMNIPIDELNTQTEMTFKKICGLIDELAGR